MNSERRKPGRPKGTEIDDTEVLNAIADILAAEHGTKPQRAMRRFKHKATQSEIRRWHAKWSERGGAFLAKAQARRAVEQRAKSTQKIHAELARAANFLPFRIERVASEKLAAQLQTLHSPTEELLRQSRGLTSSAYEQVVRDVQRSIMGTCHPPIGKTSLEAALGRNMSILGDFARGIARNSLEDEVRGLDESPISKIAKGLFCPKSGALY